MKFIECYIENFGRLQNFRYTFSEGLNSITEDNGYGKTTLSVFIKAMLYGMGDTKKTSLEENDRKHYMPWQGGRCGGYLSLSLGGKRYRIERTFMPKASDDKFALYDLDTGRECFDYGADFGEAALGIDREGFERTIFLSEKNLSGKTDNKSISAKLSDLVGCDGDIGGMDDALNLLEQRRKFYHKSGGRGEIAEIKNKISECEYEINRLERLREASDETARRLLVLKEDIARLEAERSALERGREELRQLKAKKALGEQYAERSASIKKKKERLLALERFFGDAPPTSEEIEHAKYKLAEAKKLEDGLNIQAEDREYAELSERFSGKTDISEVERMCAASDVLVGKEGEYARLEERMNERRAAFFPKGVPDEKELRDNLHALSQHGISPLSIAGLLLMLVSVPLIFLMPPLAIPMFLAGGLIMVLGIALRYEKTHGKAKRFLEKISAAPQPERERLREYMEMLLGELEASKADALASEMLRSEIGATRGKLRGFVSKFGFDGIYSLPSAVTAIKEEFFRYYRMSIGAESAARDKTAVLSRINGLKSEVSAFLGRFKTETDEPLEELKEMVRSFAYLSQSIAEEERELAGFKEKYELCEDTSLDITALLSDTEKKLSLSDAEIASKKREYALSESKYASDCESYDRIDEISGRKAELEDKAREYEEKLDIIRKTKKYLTEAKDIMTAKYLGKTKQGFEKYRSLIEGICEREYSLDTSFELTVTERGATHPHAAYSKGTRDLYALATRLALSDALYDKELPPLVLDDPFSAFDDKKLEGALEVVRSIAKERQVIYFTCQKSRSAL